MITIMQKCTIFLSIIFTSLPKEAVNRGEKYDLPSGREWRPLDAKFQKIFICVFLHAVTKWFFSMKALRCILNKVKNNCYKISKIVTLRTCRSMLGVHWVKSKRD